jgi:hypothetical protein
MSGFSWRTAHVSTDLQVTETRQELCIFELWTQ